MSFTLSKGLLKFQLIVDLYFQNFYLHFSLKISLIQTGYDSDSAMHMNYVVSLQLTCPLSKHSQSLSVSKKKTQASTQYNRVPPIQALNSQPNALLIILFFSIRNIFSRSALHGKKIKLETGMDYPPKKFTNLYNIFFASDFPTKQLKHKDGGSKWLRNGEFTPGRPLLPPSHLQWQLF